MPMNTTPRPVNAIAEIMSSPDWTAGEKWVVQWQFRFLGDFGQALAECICRADEANLARLSRAFPDEVSGYCSWAHGDLGNRLRDAGLEI